MDEFGQTLQARIAAAEAALAVAEQDGDDHGAGVELGTLDELRRIAREHGVGVS